MVTYNYLLPDDWVQVRLDPLDRSSVKQLTDRMFADIDDEVTRVRVSGWVTSRMTRRSRAREPGLPTCLPRIPGSPRYGP